MHEVSFQDKEKEHLTRLQDAEEMKVSASLDWAVLSWENLSPSEMWWQSRVRGGGTHAGQSEPIAECGLVRDELEVEESSNPEMSVDSYVVFMHYSLPLPTKREGAPLPATAWATRSG